MIICDYYSKYPIVELLHNSATSAQVSNIFERWFSVFGICNTILTDNGTQFTGKAFQDFVKKYDVSHITSSPHYPKSHGFIERMIRTIKLYLRKLPKQKSIEDVLFNYRTTPLGESLPSPSELMFGRKIPTCFPTVISKNNKFDNFHKVKSIENDLKKECLPGKFVENNFL